MTTDDRATARLTGLSLFSIYMTCMMLAAVAASSLRRLPSPSSMQLFADSRCDFGE